MTVPPCLSALPDDLPYGHWTCPNSCVRQVLVISQYIYICVCVHVYRCLYKYVLMCVKNVPMCVYVCECTVGVSCINLWSHSPGWTLSDALGHYRIKVNVESCVFSAVKLLMSGTAHGWRTVHQHLSLGPSEREGWINKWWESECGPSPQRLLHGCHTDSVREGPRKPGEWKVLNLPMGLHGWATQCPSPGCTIIWSFVNAVFD